LALRVRQGLDCRPQLINQRRAIADLLAFLDTRQSIPQCQQSLATERSGVQFFIRSNDDLALIECRGRLAGQRDPVIANDVDTHGWVSWSDPAAGAAGGPHTRSLRR